MTSEENGTADGVDIADGTSDGKQRKISLDDAERSKRRHRKHREHKERSKHRREKRKHGDKEINGKNNSAQGAEEDLEEGQIVPGGVMTSAHGGLPVEGDRWADGYPSEAESGEITVTRGKKSESITDNKPEGLEGLSAGGGLKDVERSALDGILNIASSYDSGGEEYLPFPSQNVRDERPKEGCHEESMLDSPAIAEKEGSKQAEEEKRAEKEERRRRRREARRVEEKASRDKGASSDLCIEKSVKGEAASARPSKVEVVTGINGIQGQDSETSAKRDGHTRTEKKFRVEGYAYDGLDEKPITKSDSALKNDDLANGVADEKASARSDKVSKRGCYMNEGVDDKVSTKQGTDSLSARNENDRSRRGEGKGEGDRRRGDKSEKRRSELALESSSHEKEVSLSSKRPRLEPEIVNSSQQKSEVEADKSPRPRASELEKSPRPRRSELDRSPRLRTAELDKSPYQKSPALEPLSSSRDRERERHRASSRSTDDKKARVVQSERVSQRKRSRSRSRDSKREMGREDGKVNSSKGGYDDSRAKSSTERRRSRSRSRDSRRDRDREYTSSSRRFPGESRGRSSVERSERSPLRDRQGDGYDSRRRDRDYASYRDRSERDVSRDRSRRDSSRLSRADYDRDRSRRDGDRGVTGRSDSHRRSRDERKDKAEVKAREEDDDEEFARRVTSQLEAQEEEDDVEKIKEKARLRRQAILEKFQQQQQQEAEGKTAEGRDVSEKQSSDSSVREVEPDDRGKAATTSNGFAALPPTLAMAEGGRSRLVREGEGKNAMQQAGDMFSADDIFGESPAGRFLGGGRAEVKTMEVGGLTDNWDDAEGYYTFRINEVLDQRYEVASSHGRGVFSTVVKAWDRKAGPDEPKEVAIKIIRNNETMFKAGQQELVILNKLSGADPENRRHCVRLLSSFEYRSHLCIVFESLHMNLREVLKKFGRNIGLSLTAVRSYALQLLISLKHLRNCGVLHCDIKPDNMLVNEAHNVLKLADFGSAMFAGENEITPYLVSRFYRAPEIMLGLPYDHALDMWAVGCCLYEMYSGKILFPGPSNNEMLRLHMQLKGSFPKKLLKKAAFADQHFDADFNFCAAEEDPVTKKTVTRIMSNVQPKDIGSLLVPGTEDDPKMVSHFKDLLDKMFVLDPAKRITVSQAMNHPFIMGK
eukprot:TRINITY_DN13432_c0_g2_i1.p1 TRINITY_DN13432_c0_g2~~TRINITY_DN13432_c0_g2_i1.p1  ORF type:complete len:1162 (-),score=227.24 TRINITY_DN13432_c0_g2_i1:554-4039(-)